MRSLGHDLEQHGPRVVRVVRRMVAVRGHCVVFTSETAQPALKSIGELLLLSPCRFVSTAVHEHVEYLSRRGPERLRACRWMRKSRR